MVGSALCSAQFFRAERSSYDVSLVLCFVDFVVVYGLVRKAPSLSSPVDIASLAWPFRDEQSSYDEIARLALVAIILSKPSLVMLCDYFVLAISALLVWAARFRESATTDIRTEIQRISGSPVTSPEGPTDIIPGVGSQGAVESQSVEPLNSCGAQKPETRSRVVVSSSAGATPVVRHAQDANR